MRNHWLVVLCLLALCAWVRPAHAAQSTDSCTNYITSLPATINSGHGGTWCLTGDLTVAFANTPSTVQAIEFNEQENVTLDCNNFTIQQQSPNPGQVAYGILSQFMTGITIRNCNIKGFSYGVYLNMTGSEPGTGDVLVEDNRLDGNEIGIEVDHPGGWGVVLKRNQILNSTSTGIAVNGSAEIVDNTVSGVAAIPGSGSSVSGISVTSATGARVEHNQVSGLVGDGAGAVYGLYGPGSAYLVARKNSLVGNGSPASTGMSCTGGSGRAMDNIIVGFAAALDTCGDGGGNDVSP